MEEMACRISGTGSAPIELSTLVATEFIDFKSLDFHLKATGLHDLVDINLKALSADGIICTLKTKFRYHKAQGLCSSYEGKKLEMEYDLAGLKLAINKLAESKKKGQTVRNGQSQDGKARDLRVITCF